MNIFSLDLLSDLDLIILQISELFYPAFSWY